MAGFKNHNPQIQKILVQTKIKKHKMQYEAITRKIIGCAMKVHSTPGCGIQEVIYQRAMAIEMEIRGLRFAGIGNDDLL